MKKQDRYTESILRNNREKHRLQRLRLNRIFRGYSSAYFKEHNFLRSVDEKIAKNFKSPLYDYFIEKEFITGSEKTSDTILIPSDFSFCKNYNGSIEVLKKFTVSIFKYVGQDITLDFSQCKHVDYSALFVLQILRLEFLEELNKLDRKMSVLSGRFSFKIKDSPHEEVQKHLFMAGLIPQAVLKIEGLLPIDTTGYLKGTKSQKHYSENKKGVIATKIVNYINNCLGHHEYMLLPEGKNHFGGLISEILNNAEDHSPHNTYYASANFLLEPKKNPEDSVAGQINLTFMNFGYSIYEGFEATKMKNSKIYSMLEEIYTTVKKSKLYVPFTRENLFTLYSLQEGISRLHFEDESRGSGTVRFINSFFDLGDYEDDIKDYHPSLSIVSGSTQLICNNNFKPIVKDGVFVLSLNPENNLLKAPEKSNLETLKYSFPGTLFSVRIYLNKQHIRNKIDGNGKNSA